MIPIPVWLQLASCRYQSGQFYKMEWNNELDAKEVARDKKISFESLFSLSVKNLESRIAGLRQDLRNRVLLSHAIHERLQRERMDLEIKMPPLAPYGLRHFLESRRSAIEKDLLSIERDRIREALACFRDSFMIRQEIRSAEERLNREQAKSNLVSA